ARAALARAHRGALSRDARARHPSPELRGRRHGGRAGEGPKRRSHAGRRDTARRGARLPGRVPAPEELVWNPDRAVPIQERRHMTLIRMDHVSIVVDDLPAAVAFFVELGMKKDGEQPVEGSWVDRVNGIQGVRVDIVMMQTPDGHGRVELTKFRTPAA